MLRGHITGTVQGVAANNNYLPYGPSTVRLLTTTFWSQPTTISLDSWPTTMNRYITGTVQGGEDNGDLQAWQTLSDKAVRRQIELERELAQVAGKSINWNSPEQVRELLSLSLAPGVADE
jgi:hypothetical protein